jgi:hypothetical protein
MATTEFDEALKVADEAAKFPKLSGEFDNVNEFNKFIEESGLPSDRYTYDSTNKNVTTNFKGKEIEVKKFAESFEIGADGKLPDFEKAFENLGLTDEQISSLQKEIDDFKAEFEKKYKDEINLKKNISAGEADAKTTKPPTNADDLSNNNKSVKNAAEEIKKNDGKTMGNFVKTVINLTALGLTLTSSALVYAAVTKHQEEMNGCWKIKTDGTKKCKIAPLTCNTNSRNSAGEPDDNNIGFCSYCQQENVENCQLTFNRCIKDGDGSFYTAGKTGPGTDGKSGCANAVGEPVDSNCQDNTWCSKHCNCDMSANCEEGYRLQCVEVNFWTAWRDMGLAPFEPVGEALKTVVEIAKYVAIGCAVILGIFLIFKLISYLFSKKNTTPPPEMYPPQMYPPQMYPPQMYPPQMYIQPPPIEPQMYQ